MSGGTEPLDKLENIEAEHPQISEDTPQSPSLPPGEWDRYFKEMLDSFRKQQVKYYERVKELSTSDEFVLKFVKEGTASGKYEIIEKTFQRRKITVNQWNKVEQMRAALSKMKDRESIVKQMADIYFELAQAYFGLTKEEYGNADWDTIKLAIDACNHRTQYGIPF